MIQPRLGVTWAYDGTNTARELREAYNPAANSCRGRRRDRNLSANIRLSTPQRQSVRHRSRCVVHGQALVPDMTPRTINEICSGRRQIGQLDRPPLRPLPEGTHYWEDTQNTARVTFNPRQIFRKRRTF
jgi:hypothetical protein